MLQVHKGKVHRCTGSHLLNNHLGSYKLWVLIKKNLGRHLLLITIAQINHEEDAFDVKYKRKVFLLFQCCFRLWIRCVIHLTRSVLHSGSTCCNLGAKLPENSLFVWGLFVNVSMVAWYLAGIYMDDCLCAHLSKIACWTEKSNTKRFWIVYSRAENLLLK